MGLYKYIREAWKQPREGLGELWQQRLVEWRKDPATLRLEHPTRLDRARSLGYKAKQGIFVVRERVLKGSHVRPQPYSKGGRRTKHATHRLDLKKSYQVIAEQRVSRQYRNCEVLNSYWVAEDGMHKWFEVIMADRTHPSIVNDSHYSWLANARGRVFRGITSAAKKSRGLRIKGKGAEKNRPSLRAHKRRGN